ncbi:MAG: hypothetical protein ACKVWR_20805 [Acidimicrobiales bacterium]
MTELAFVAWHEAALPPGRYTVRVGQRLTARRDDGAAAIDEAFGDLAALPSSGANAGSGASLVFASHGPRVSLPASALAGRFPPAGSAAHEDGVVPHVLLSDPTLPWIRVGGPAGSTGGPVAPLTPWLALVVFAGDELTRIGRQTTTAGALGLDDEPGQRADEAALELSIPADLAARLLPTLADARLLAHVRETPAPAGSGAGETPDLGASAALAVVVANRAVVPAVLNEAHLVRIESIDLDAVVASPAGAAGAGGPPANLPPVRLLSLATWSFHPMAGGAAFRDLAVALAHNSGPLHARTGEPLADTWLRRGAVPLRHGTGVSFYRGPLAPSPSDPNTAAIVETFNNSLPERAEQLVLYDTALGMADVSYAVAWNLGRSLALADLDIALSLDDYRRARRRQQHLAGQLDGLADHRVGDVSLPEATVAWLRNLAEVTSVPDRYLLADLDRLVPERQATWTEHGTPRQAEGTLAWFAVDRVWSTLLVQGAMSVAAGLGRDGSDRPRVRPPREQGFVLRSPLVRWDDLQIRIWPVALDELARLDALDDSVTPLPHRRREVGAGVCMVIFAQSSGPSTVEISRKPEGLHFGVADGTDTSRKLDVAGLAAAAGAADAASFAVGMVQRSPRLRFQLDIGTPGQAG